MPHFRAPAPQPPLMTESKYYGLLLRCFSTEVFRELSSSGRSGLLGHVLRETNYLRGVGPGTTLRQLFDSLFDLLFKHHRAEYVYKNAIAEKILMGRHSPAASALFTEFRAGRAKADVVIVNGTSTAYEIKTELDSLGRLPGQLASYARIFDRVYVVTHESLAGKIERAVGRDVGLLCLTDRYSLRRLRAASSNADRVDPVSIFDCLRQDEYCEIVRQEFGYLPESPGTWLDVECQKLFATLNPSTAHRRLVEVLGRRARGPALAGFVEAAPRSLKALCAAHPPSARRRAIFLEAINSPYGLHS